MTRSWFNLFINGLTHSWSNSNSLLFIVSFTFLTLLYLTQISYCICVCISQLIESIKYIYLLYAYCSFSAVIGQIMVTWPPYKSDIGVQYYFPTLKLRDVRFMCSILNFTSWKGTQQNWIEIRSSEEFGLLVKSWSG